MWLILAFLSAFFAGITSILAKSGISGISSNLATALRTAVVLAFSWAIVFISGAYTGISSIGARPLIFLILSGLATGASWLCYFRALQLGDINKVMPIDKFSTVISIILAFAVLGEPVSVRKIAAAAIITAGIFLMITPKRGAAEQKSRSWIIYASLSAVFAALVSILGKIGVTGIDSNLGTAIRTAVVLVMSWLVVFAEDSQHQIREISAKNLGFLIVSGITTGASWLCYFRALQTGPASVIVPVDKLSVLVTAAFSYIVFKERLSAKAILGLILLTGGTILMI